MKTTKQLTSEQVELLAPYEDYFRKAVYSDWSPYPGINALKIMHEIAGGDIRLNANCSACVLKLIKDCGRLYYEARVRQAEKKVVAVAEVEAQVVKVEVKTAKKRTSKKK